MNYPPLPEVSFFDAGPRQYTESHMRAYIDADRKARATAEPMNERSAELLVGRLVAATLAEERADETDGRELDACADDFIRAKGALIRRLRAPAASAEPVATAVVTEYCSDDKGEVSGECWNTAHMQWQTGFLATLKVGDRLSLFVAPAATVAPEPTADPLSDKAFKLVFEKHYGTNRVNGVNGYLRQGWDWARAALSSVAPEPTALKTAAQALLTRLEKISDKWCKPERDALQAALSGVTPEQAKDGTATACPYCNKPAPPPEWTENERRRGWRWDASGKHYHCREAAIED